jgi:hypothetical protein
MNIAIREEYEKEIVYTAIKDDDERPIKFKSLADAEEKLRAAALEVNPSVSFVILDF